jgi:predicted GNAT family acetyltransferase
MKTDEQAASLTCIDCGAYVDETNGGIAICDACFAVRGSCCAEFGALDAITEQARHDRFGPDCSAHPADHEKPTIQHDVGERRFYNASGAMLEYRMTPGGDMQITHTFVPDKLRGLGLAADLMEAATGHARQNDLMISATCSYARIYLERKRASR